MLRVFPPFVVLVSLLLCVPAAGQIPDLTGDETPEPIDRTVSIEHDPARDDAIEARLEAIYDQLDDLAEVEVETHAGVVRLSGEVLSMEDHDLAVELARNVQGVVAVDDDLREVRDVQRRLRPALDKVKNRLLDLAALGPLLGVALIVFLLFWGLARWLGHRERIYARLTPNRFLQDLTRQILRAVILILGVLMALEILDATALVGAVLGTAGLVGLALGFAFRDTAENYIASVLLSVRQPFSPNDHVLVDGHEGKVIRLTSRATLLLTLDGNHVRIPNSQVFKGVVTNYTRNPERRFDFVVGVGTEADLTRAQNLGLETLRDMPGILEEPGPMSWIDELGDSNVLVHFYAWVDQREVGFAKARGEAIRRVKEAFDDADISMPEPIHRVLLKQEEPAPKPKRTPVQEPALDLTPETHLDRKVEEDRAAEEGRDLLDEDTPLE